MRHAATWLLLATVAASVAYAAPTKKALAAPSTRNITRWRMPLNDLADAPLFESKAPDDPSGYYMWSRAAENPGDPTRHNQVLVLGYNCGKGGGPQVAGIIGICFLQESYWHDGSFPQTELHLAYIMPNATQVRFMTARLRHDNLAASTGFNSEEFFFNTLGPTGKQPLLRLSSDVLEIHGQISKQNTGLLLTQLNAARNGYRSVIFLGANDQVTLGDDLTRGTVMSETASCATPPAGKVALCVEPLTGKLCIKRASGTTKCLAEEP